MKRFLRYLRIAFSITCLIACVLLIALWVRSHVVIDGIVYSKQTPTETSAFVVNSDNGTLRVMDRVAPTSSAKGFTIRNGWDYYRRSIKNATVDTFYFYRKRDEGFIIRFPILIPALLFAATGIAPWVYRQFSLRMLLIATTLAAVVLGLIVWLSR